MQWSVDLHPVTGEWRVIDREGEIVCVSLHGEKHLSKIAAAPDMFEALKKAREFIRNGVELGFIRMPDASTTDPAHDTLPAIEAALAKASNGEAVDG